MNKRRLLLYLAFAVYQLCVFTFTVMVDGHLDLLGLLKFIPVFKYLGFLGFVFIVVDFVWSWIEHKRQTTENEYLRKTNNELKAAIYDLKHGSK